MAIYRKTPTQREMLDQLRRGRVELPPLSLRLIEAEPQAGATRRSDTLIEASWRGKKARFLVECKALSTPKAFQAGLNQLKAAPLPRGGLAHAVSSIPWRKPAAGAGAGRDQRGRSLRQRRCRSCPVRFSYSVPAGRTGFSSSAPIKNIYRKNSAMVGRVFLLRPGYATVQEICAEINRLNLLVNRWDKKPMSLSTVSKALKTLEEDLLVARNETIRLIQPDKLLETLSQNYISRPSGKGSVSGSQPKAGRCLSCWRICLGRWACPWSPPVCLPLRNTPRCSGESCCQSIARGWNRSWSGCREIRRIAFRISKCWRQTMSRSISMRGRTGDFLWASPIQVYLELMAGDKRDRESAEQVRTLLLKNLEQVGR